MPDVRLDIHALGMVAFELLLGEKAFLAECKEIYQNESETSRRWINWHQDFQQQFRPLSEINPEIPPRVAQIVARMLSKDRLKRYGDVGAILRDLNDRPRDADESLMTEQAKREGPPNSPFAHTAATPSDNDVQFTVFRPRTVVPDKWQTLLAFAHLTERPANASKDEPDPATEVRMLAEQLLGSRADQYTNVTQDSSMLIPREGDLTFLPTMTGIEFNPPSFSFRWQEMCITQSFVCAPRRIGTNTWSEDKWAYFWEASSWPRSHWLYAWKAAIRHSLAVKPWSL